MAASRVVYPANSQMYEPHIRTASSSMASSPPTRVRTSGIFTRRLSLTAASVANSVSSSSLFGSSPPPSSSSSIYQQSSFFRSSSSAINSSPAAGSSSIDVSSFPNSSSLSAVVTGEGTTRRPRMRSTSHPPPPKYKTSRTPQLRISLQDAVGGLVLSPPVMAPGESIRGQIHLELPKATPVHSIEVCLTGTVAALDGTRLGSMKTVTFLEECKTVATASITNARTNTTRRHATSTSGAAAAATITITGNDEEAPGRRRNRRSSVTGIQDGARSPAIPIQNTVAAAVAATMAVQGNSQRPSAEQMSRTLSMPSPYFTTSRNASTMTLNRPTSPTSADLRGRRSSFSANVDTPIGGFGGIAGRTGRNMSMVNIGTLGQFPVRDIAIDSPSLPEAPSYDPPNYERIFTSTAANEQSSGESSSVGAVVPSQSESFAPETGNGNSIPGSTGADDASTSVPTPSPSNSSENVSISAPSRRSSRESRNDQTSVATSAITAVTATPIESAEPKAVLMQPGNYVIPFSIRIPSNSAIPLPGSFSDHVGTISYQLKAVMKQILPSPDPYDPRALLVEPTFTSAIQVIKLIPMNDPALMPLYNVPFETESVRANVGHWVWSTGFLEAHAWVPKQGYRPGRMIPLVIHIVNHSDARQVTVETTLCKCLHYGAGLSKVRAMGVAGQGHITDQTLAFPPAELETAEEGSLTQTNERVDSEGRRRHASQRNLNIDQQETSIPSPPASPYGSSFPTTPTNEREGDFPEGSVHGSRMTSPNSIASIPNQWESAHCNSSDSNTTPMSSGSIVYNPESRHTMTSPTPSSSATASSVSAPLPQQQPLPIVQQQRQKMSKSKTLVSCSLAVDREIQKTIPVPIPHTAGYSILNAPLLEVSYEIVIKIRAEKVYSKGIRLSVPIVVVVPEEGDFEEEEELLVNAGLASPAMMARDLGLTFSGDEYDLGDQGECPPYEATASSSNRGRSRR